MAAEAAWQALAAAHDLPLHIFRLAGIYGPGRGPFQKVRDGTARRIVKPGQVFSRIHAQDIGQVLEASIRQPAPGTIYNVCDDDPAPPEAVLDHAARLLGRPHRMRGTVVHGAARGRELGFPTANLAPDADGYIPADGVYAGWLTDASGRRWPVAVSVGSNPTFEGVSRVVEAHVIDRPRERVEDFDLYGQEVIVEFIARLRGMVAYEGTRVLAQATIAAAS